MMTQVYSDMEQHYVKVERRLSGEGGNCTRALYKSILANMKTTLRNVIFTLTVNIAE